MEKREDVTKQGSCKILWRKLRLRGSLLLVLIQFWGGWGGGGRLFEFKWEWEGGRVAWALIRGWALINFFCLKDRRLFKWALIRGWALIRKNTVHCLCVTFFEFPKNAYSLFFSWITIISAKYGHPIFSRDTHRWFWIYWKQFLGHPGFSQLQC